MRGGRVLFITGVTGFVGSALALELLRNNPRDRAFCLVRATDDSAALRRVQNALIAAADAYDVSTADLESALARVFALRGDLTAPRLGLDDEQRARLRDAGQLTVWHCAASLKDAEKALREIVAHNVAGTERLLDVVLEHDVAVFNHVSTAYVAGRAVGHVEETAERPRGFSNRYEQSKHYGEQIVIDYCERADVPYRILRPGIVIGHSVTGRATGYTGFLGWILKVAALNQMSGGALTYRPLRYVGRPKSELNIVPIDSVVEDCIGIDRAGDKTLGRVFHLTNTQPPKVRWLCDVTTNTLGLEPIELVDDENELDPVSMKFHKWTRFERPYTSSRKQFSRRSNELYDSPRHGAAPLSKLTMQRMIRFAVQDYRKQEAQRSKGVA
jgi:nucleoside-diphosphate-sugar epimerase